jgi:hypothetical protein
MNTYSSSKEYLTNNGVNFNYEIKHGDVSSHKGESVFEVKANNDKVFEMDVTQMVTMREDSPFYGIMMMYAERILMLWMHVSQKACG